MHAKATLVCAGSYSRNKEIMNKMQPIFYQNEGKEPVRMYACATCTGDGITMCEEIGANIDYVNKRAAMFGPMHHPFSYGVLSMLRGGTSVQVNKYGQEMPSRRWVCTKSAVLPISPAGLHGALPISSPLTRSDKEWLNQLRSR